MKSNTGNVIPYTRPFDPEMKTANLLLEDLTFCYCLTPESS